MLRQESTSAVCTLRILYQMLADQNREKNHKSIETRLLNLVSTSLSYFLSLSSEIHKDSWTPALLLIFTRILQLPTESVSAHVHHTGMYLSWGFFVCSIRLRVQYEINSTSNKQWQGY